MSDLRLPAHIHEDPRRGQRGGRYVLITCRVCGRVVRKPMSYLLGLMNRGWPLPQYCSRMCYAAAQRRRR